MGHEVGHVEARHAAERMSQQVALELGVSLAAAALSEEYGHHAESIAGALGAGALYGVILPYSRMQELEANRLGFLLMRGLVMIQPAPCRSGGAWRATARCAGMDVGPSC
jgi:Zn-dependent protease with chaperone function